MKAFIKRWLKSKNVYDRLKYSYFFNVYERLFKPEVIAQHKKEVELYKSFLNHTSLVFDIGAYDGHKTAAFVEIADKVISCEPDPFSFSILQTRFRHVKNKVTPVNCAVYHQKGQATLQRNYEGSAFNTLNEDWKNILEKDNASRWTEKIAFQHTIAMEVKTTTLDELITQFGTPDFIKIDAEGSEWEIIRGLSQKVNSISFECLLPEFSSQLIQILDKLIFLDKNYQFNIIHNEELLFEETTSLEETLQWIKTTELYSFDMLAISK